MRTPLCELALKYRTDKVKDVYHDYTPFYFEILKSLKVRRLLEIGIGTPVTMTYRDYLAGASLRMWAEFLPEAEIFGLDIDGLALINEGRIHSLQCDQGNNNALRAAAEKFGGNFDLIIDDGSHVPYHQVLSVRTLWPFLSPGGIFVIEDVKDKAIVNELDRAVVYEFDPELPSKDNRLIVLQKAAA